ncbi:MAG: hypothetical protein KAQ83_01215 [Nanoarchaeota archaeon]|nr:hypothetical protein [Nanoarchaeota archaeon]
MSPDILYWWLFPVVIWSAIWKGIALWKCGRRNQIVWFVLILILNTAGILPILYLLFFQRKPKKVIMAKRPVKKAVKSKPVKAKKKVSKKRKR